MEKEKSQQKDGKVKRRISAHEIRVLLPVSLFYPLDLDLLFGKAKPDLSAERRKRDVKQAGHMGIQN